MWQPIPVHTMPVKIDNLIASDIPDCPSYHKAYNKYFESNEMKSFRESNRPIYEFLSTHTGAPVTHFDDIWSVSDIYDSWKCENIHNLP